MKNRFLLAILLLPLFLFGQWNVFPYYYSDASTSVLPDVSYSSIPAPTNSSPVYAWFSGGSIHSSPTLFGFAVSSESRSLFYPAAINSDNTSTSKTANRFVYETSSKVYRSPMYFEDVQHLYTFIYTLVLSGYSGPGLYSLSIVDGVMRYNVDPPLLLSSALFGTNTFYRSQVVGFLDSLSSSSFSLLQNSNLSLPLLQSLVRDFKSLNSFSLEATNSVYGLPTVMTESPLFYWPFFPRRC